MNFVSKIWDTVLGGIGFVWKTAYSIVTAPSRLAWGLTAGAIALSCLGLYLSRQWVEAKPNQWLLLIRGGNLCKSGVGLKTFATPMDTVVTFPSKVERVYFDADNVTKEMQGVKIAGFAFWSIYREGDGPFRFYKYMQGLDPNSSVQALCNGALRSLIANSTLDEVMKNRDYLRNNIQDDLKDQFKGWGIWLESIEITEVRVCSKSLFQDLQAEYRQSTKLSAELIKLEGNLQLQETKLSTELRMHEKEVKNETRKVESNFRQKLMREEQEEAFNAKNFDIQVQKIERDFQLRQTVLSDEHDQEVTKRENRQSIQAAKNALNREKLAKQIEIDSMHDETTLRIYKINATERMYRTIGVRAVSVNHFAADGSLLGLIPTLRK